MTHQRTMNEPGEPGYRNRLREVMEREGLTVPYLSQLTNIPRYTLYSYLKRTHRLVIARHVEVITRHTNIDPLELITWEAGSLDSSDTHEAA